MNNTTKKNACELFCHLILVFINHVKLVNCCSRFFAMNIKSLWLLLLLFLLFSAYRGTMFCNWNTSLLKLITFNLRITFYCSSCKFFIAKKIYGFERKFFHIFLVAPVMWMHGLSFMCLARNVENSKNWIGPLKQV